MTNPKPWPQARQIAHKVGSAAARPIERCPLPEAAGRVLGSDLVARAGLPGFDTSAMDGWAVCGGSPWLVVGQSLAGAPHTGRLAAGQAVLVATGAAVPPGTTSVVRSEHGLVRSGVLRAAQPHAGEHIRPANEECRAGDVLALAGSVITAATIAVAAATGWDSLPVYPRPRAAVVLFGDELVTSGVAPFGYVRDCLGPAMPAWLSALGARVSSVRQVQDTLDAHVAAIAQAVAGADLVITTGGTASGPVDHMHEALGQVPAELVIDQVAVRPGHPMLLAVAEHAGVWVPVVGLPGNPQSAVITLATLAGPVIAGMSGNALAELGTTTALEQISAPHSEHRLVPGRREPDGLHPSRLLGSAMLRGLLSANGFAVVPPGGAAPGDELGWLGLPGSRLGSEPGGHHG